MQLRLLLVAISVLFLEVEHLRVGTLSLVACFALFSWLVSHYWHVLVPWALAYPVLAWVDVLVSFAVLGVAGLDGPFFLFTLVNAAVAGLLYRWPGMVVMCLSEICFYYVILGWRIDEDPGTVTFQMVVGQPLYYLLLGFSGVALRRLLDEQATQEEARREAEVRAAAWDERARLAREMHDSLAKTLRGVALSASALPLWLERDAGRAVKEAEQVVAAVEIASREARELLVELREDRLSRPLAEVVRETAESWGAEHGVAIECALDAEVELEPLTRHELHSILNEVLTNVARHARAGEVSIGLAREGEKAVLTVDDDGVGFEPVAPRDLARGGHYGLIGLHERAERVNGEVEVLGRPGRGTGVTARFPLHQDVSAGEVR